MVRRTLTVVGALFLGLLTVGIAFVLGMRRVDDGHNGCSPPSAGSTRPSSTHNSCDWQAPREPTRRCCAIAVGPRADAMRPGWAVATEDGFVIALVYGSQTDWLKNVLASGSATIVHEGHTYRLDRPEVIPMATAAAWLSAKDRRNHRLFGVDRCLRVRWVEPGAAAGQLTDPL